MSKLEQVLIYSIQSEHVLNFLKGYKTIEVRKRDLPQWAKDKLERGEVVEGYGYCTKGGKRLLYEKQPKHPYYILSNSDGPNSGNGKVVVKFQVSGVSRFDYDERINHYTYGNMQVDNMTEFLKNVCITENDIWNYGSNSGFKPLYAHHFTNITPIEPMELGKFSSDIPKNKCDEAYLNFYLFSNRLRKAPQSFMTCWVKGE